MIFKKLILIFVVGFLLISVGNADALSYPMKSVGQDISWPNCANLKFDPASFGIVGVNGGLSFHPNPCIGAESSLYKQNLSLYVNTGFPGKPRDLLFQYSPLDCSSDNTGCLAYNYGFNAGRYATNYALSRGVVSNNWWLDVESINSWSTSPVINQLSLIGEKDGINSAVNPSSLGYYAFPPGWKILTNDWKNNLPNWVASNSNYYDVAVKQCNGFNFTGGKTQLTQYIGKLDLDISC